MHFGLSDIKIGTEGTQEFLAFQLQHLPESSDLQIMTGTSDSDIRSSFAVVPVSFLSQALSLRHEPPENTTL